MPLLPSCKKCNAGDLVPLSDEGRSGGSVSFKAWVCTNPACDFCIKIQSGSVQKCMEPMRKVQ